MLVSQVIAGDYQGREIKTSWGGDIYINAKGGERIIIDSSTVKSYEVLEIDDRKSFSSSVTRGLVGGAVLGGVGAIAGINSAKSIKNAKIKIQFKNGKCSLLYVDKILYDAIINRCFNLDAEENTYTHQSQQTSSIPSATSDKFCTNCGSQLTGNEKFCSSCGHSTETAVISEVNIETTPSTPVSEPTKEETALERAKEKSASADAELSEAIKKVKEDISNNFGKKTYTPKQIKKFFIIAISIAAVISLVLLIAMHSPEDDIATNVMMFIFCTIVFSIPLVIGTLLMCLPSIRKNRKNRDNDK